MKTEKNETSTKVSYREIPIVKGQLFELDTIRPKLLYDVCEITKSQIKNGDLDSILGEALYQERMRLRSESFNPFTQKRKKQDQALWSQVKSGLVRSPTQVDREEILGKILTHYAEEIGGHFNPKVYEFATNAVPFGLTWLFNALSFKRWSPKKWKASIEDCLRVEGNIEQLQTLSQKGTILMVPTHQSNLDSLLVGYVIALMNLPPFCYGAGLNLFTNPVFSYFMGNLGAYTVDRKKSNRIYKQILKNYSSQVLTSGIHSIFFPGGGRCRNGAIESKLKLGLLGTGLEAQIQNYKLGKSNPNIFVVPMVMSYNFILEASSLIDQYLAVEGQHRFFRNPDQTWPILKIARFLKQVFIHQSSVTVRIGRAMDVFGNFVDEEGRSLGPNGTIIDPKKWLTSCGEIQSVQQRDQEYTRILGEKIVERFYAEHTVLPSQLVAFTIFESLRKAHPDLDLYQFLRISPSQRTLPEETLLMESERMLTKIRELEKNRKIHISRDFEGLSVSEWLTKGMIELGAFHGSEIVRKDGSRILVENMNLLYYYRNRLSGFGLSTLADSGYERKVGQHDRKGFLA